MTSPLSPQLLEVLRLSDGRGKPWKEVAEAMGLPIGTVSKYRERALEELAAIDLTSREGLLTMAETIAAVFGQGPDGGPLTLPGRISRDELRDVRNAYATVRRGLAEATRGLGDLIAVLERIEGEEGDDVEKQGVPAGSSGRDLRRPKPDDALLGRRPTRSEPAQDRDGVLPQVRPALSDVEAPGGRK